MQFVAVNLDILLKFISEYMKPYASLHEVTQISRILLIYVGKKNCQSPRNLCNIYINNYILKIFNYFFLSQLALRTHNGYIESSLNE